MAISTINQNGLNAPLTLTSPVLTTPNLGTPSALVLTNATGLPAAAMPAGSVLQVVNAIYGTQVTASTETWVDTGLTASITPKYATSKILVLVNQVGLAKDSDNGGLYLQLLRNGSTLINLCTNDLWNNTTGVVRAGGVGATYLDNPATTSAVTYKTQFFAFYNRPVVYVQQGSNAYSTITLMEIAQ